MDTSLGPNQNAGNPRNLRDIFEAVKPDAVVHLAGSVLGEEDVMQTVRENAGMTSVLAQVAGEFGIRVVYASTDEVYGDNGSSVCHEINGPWSLPQSIDGLSKLWGEEACKLYAPKGFTALRFSMPYGPGLPVGRAAISTMLWQAKHGVQIPVHSGAERSWCWIGDTVRAARAAIENGDGPYNVGRADHGFDMKVVAELACEITGADRSLIKMTDAPEQQAVKRLSTARIRQLGWEPVVDLGEGMRRTFAWLDQLDSEGNLVTGLVVG
jgi:nucleoside-diphosphate-sugar epimerase